MKSLCEYCIFNTKENGTQTGCELRRLDKYEKELVNNNYVLEGHCNFLRNVYWPHQDKKDRLNIVIEEEVVKYAVIYNYTGDDEKLRTTLRSIPVVFEPLDFIICYDDKVCRPITEIHNLAKYYYPNVKVVQAINDEMSFDTEYELAMKRTSASYLYFIDEGEKLDKKCLNELNFLINESLRTVYIIAGKTFTICFKKLFEKYAFKEQPMQKMHDDLINSKYKDCVITWNQQ